MISADYVGSLWQNVFYWSLVCRSCRLFSLENSNYISECNLDKALNINLQSVLCVYARLQWCKKCVGKLISGPDKDQYRVELVFGAIKNSFVSPHVEDLASVSRQDIEKTSGSCIICIYCLVWLFLIDFGVNSKWIR